MKKFCLFLDFLILGIFIFPLRHIGADGMTCDSGAIMNNGIVTEIPTYDYGPDGLVQFHFNLKSGAGGLLLYYMHYGNDCSYRGFNTFTFANKNFVPNIQHMVLKATTLDGVFYGFSAYNEDTGEPIGLGPMPSSFALDENGSPVAAIKIFTYDGYPRFPGYNEFGVLTPAVPVKGQSPQSNKTPILIVPGVMGTQLISRDILLWPDITRMIDSDDSFMDDLSFDSVLKPIKQNIITSRVVEEPFPGQHFYDLLQKEFEGQGYTEGKDLFTFPYDWRYGVSEDVTNQLKGQIDYIINQTDAGKAVGKVDIVAHSMGGLVVKKYVQENPDHHINKAVFLGVPNTGAPKSIKMLLVGDNMGVPGLSDAEMQYLAHNMPAVYDLAPSKKYYSNKGSFFRTVTQTGFLSRDISDLTFDETTDYLTNIRGLNTQAFINSQDLHSLGFDNLDLRDQGIDLYNIVGCKAGTIGKITETIGDDPVEPLYNFDEIPGDGTVPLESATNLPVDSSHKYYALKASHAKMPSQDGIRQTIVNIISGSQLDAGSSMTQDIGNCKLKGKSYAIYSPVSMEIIDQDGNRAGIAGDGSVQNDIPNADYNIAGERKFAYVPTDEGQTYIINLAGTGNGKFTLEVSDLDGDAVETKTFRDIPVSARTKAQLVFVDDVPKLKMDFEGDGNFEQILEPNSNLGSKENSSTTPAVADVAPVVPNSAPPEILVHPPVTSMPEVLGVSTQVSAHRPGTLILDSDGRTIYIIGNTKRYGFRRPDEFFTYGFSFAEVVPANVADEMLPEGEVVKAKPGTVIYDADGYYLVLANGEKGKFRDYFTLVFKGYDSLEPYLIDASDYSPAEPITEFAPALVGTPVFDDISI